jgi:transporter family-2 protein
MSAAFAIAIAIAAGAGLLVQSVILVGVSQRVGLPAALLVNTLVGLAVILALVLRGGALSFFSELASNWRWWFIIPGLLGTGFVAANIAAVARLGTVASASLIIASQLAAAAAADSTGWSGSGHAVTPLRLAGLVLLLAGAVCAVRG